MDTMSRRKRSRLMARIGPKGTKPEMAVRKALRRLRVGYRCNVRGMPGTPDVVLAKYRLVIFVHGCFWHQHDCPAGTFPSTNRRFWAEKFGRNCARDERNTKELARACAKRGTALEISAGHPYMTEDFVRIAARQGAMFTIGSDAHRARDVGNLARGARIARSAGLDVGRVLNAMEVEDGAPPKYETDWQMTRHLLKSHAYQGVGEP